MYQGVPRSAPFDLAKTHEIALFETAISMLEFPQRRLGRAGMKHVADFVKSVHVKLPHKGGDICVFEILGQDLGELV